MAFVHANERVDVELLQIDSFKRRIKMKKKLMAATSICLVASMLTACGGSSGAANTSSTEGASDAVASSTESSTGAVATSTSESDSSSYYSKEYSGTTIRVLSMTGQISDALQNHLSEFEQETGIKVNLELYGEADLRQKLTTEFVAGDSTVDAFMLSPLQDLKAFSQNGWIEPLDTYIKKDSGFDWSDFSSAPTDQITIQSSGEIGALPLYSSVQLLFYRKDIFEKAGITNPPTTYDELLDVCKKINDPSNNFYAIACRGEKVALTSQFSPFLYGYGGSFIKDGKCNFGSEEDINAAKFYGELLGNYAPDGILSAGYSQMTQLFNSGEVGMCIDAVALYQTLIDEDESQYYDQVGVAAIPEGPEGRQSYKQVVWGSSIYSGSKNKGAAWEFLKYAASTEIADEITPQGMPTFRASVWKDDNITSNMPEDYIDAYNTEIQADTTNQYGLPRMTSVSEARDAMGEAIVYSIETKGQGSELQKKMQEAADTVDQLLKESNEYGEDYPY